MGTTQVDIKSDAFARRLANLLTDRRESSGATVRELVKASERAFSARFLKAVEDGRAELDEQTVCELAALYGAELAEILPTRMPLRIATPGVISTSGISTEFDPDDRDSLLTSYLLLIRQLRAQEREPIIDLRREDVETLAEFLHEPGPSVLERLSTLMGATVLQRRAMVGMFIAGAIVIGLAGSGVAAFGGALGGSTPASEAAPTSSPSTASAPAVPLADDPSAETVTVSANGTPMTPIARELREGTAAAPAVVDTAPPPTLAPPETIIVYVEDATPLPEPQATTVPTAPTTPTTVPGSVPVQVATGTPPVVPTSSPAPSSATPTTVAVGDAPVPAPDPVIPDVPYDLPSTTAATATPPVPATPTTTATPTTATPTTATPTTTAPPAPATTVDTGTPATPPTDAPVVDVGPPPLPPDS